MKMDALSGKVAIVGLTSSSIKDNFSTPLNTPPHYPYSYDVQVHAAVVQQMMGFFAGQSKALRSPAP